MLIPARRAELGWTGQVVSNGAYFRLEEEASGTCGFHAAGPGWKVIGAVLLPFTMICPFIRAGCLMETKIQHGGQSASSAAVHRMDHKGQYLYADSNGKVKARCQIDGNWHYFHPAATI